LTKIHFQIYNVNKFVNFLLHEYVFLLIDYFNKKNIKKLEMKKGVLPLPENFHSEIFIICEKNIKLLQ